MSTRHDGKPIVVGGGIAGLLTALHLAPVPVLLLSRSPLGVECASAWAQGGLAASLGTDDTLDLHLADTIKAGGELCDKVIARKILEEAPQAVEFLTRLGVQFDRIEDGDFRLGLEAAHGRRRIIHANGGGSGHEIMRALVIAVRNTPSIEVIENLDVRRIITHDSVVGGVVAEGVTGAAFFITSRVVLATGGIGGLFLDSTNPLGSFGQGLALAARAGAALENLEFVQFHPTALDVATRPLPLVSEAIRGEGAVIIDETGHRFLTCIPGAELAPRDILTHAIGNHLSCGHRAFLDARKRPGKDFARRFPGINSVCRDAGIDPVTDPIPIRPAQHYHMGGVAVDQCGRSTVEGLWACGEVACTGLHGANRLASNSLTEAAVCAQWVAESVGTTPARHSRRTIELSFPKADPTLVRPIVSGALGISRDRESLTRAVGKLLPLAMGTDAASEPAIVGLAIAVAALQRKESRGAHNRTDYPFTPAMAKSSLLLLNDVLMVAHSIEGLSCPKTRRA
jgi:L-aspartate oxidase